MQDHQGPSRRGVLGALGAASASLVPPNAATAQEGNGDQLHAPTGDALQAIAKKRGFKARQQRAFQIRGLASLDGIGGTTDPLPVPRGTDDDLRPVHFTKSLIRDTSGGKDPSLPDPKAFSQFRKALDQAYTNALAPQDLGGAADFDAIEKLEPLIGSPPDPALKDQKLKFTNPLGGLGYEIEGLDPPYTSLGPPLAFDAAEQFTTAETAAQMAEVYWLARLRDVPFSDLDAPMSTAALDPEVKAAFDDLNAFSWYGPSGVGDIPLNRLFRADLRTHRNQRSFGFDGVEVGPYLSQFLLVGTPELKAGRDESAGIVNYGTLRLGQQQRTVVARKDYLFRPAPLNVDKELLAVLNGSRTAIGTDEPDSTLRFIRTLRDGANYVHFDEIYQEYLIAASILLARIPRVGNTILSAAAAQPEIGVAVSESGIAEFTSVPDQMLNVGNPYRNAKAQVGFATFGVTHILTLLAEVATRAHKAAWYHKWSLRWLRPEEFAARVHYKLVNGIDAYRIHEDLISSASPGSGRQILSVIRAMNASAGLSYLLPMAYPEGCPTHPARPSGHSTVAGASTTILKGLFNGFFPLTSRDGPASMGVLVPNREGTMLTPYRDQTPLTIGGELNKLASNVSLFRMMGGVHWRGDSVSGLLLGEQIGVHLLIEQTQAIRDQSGRVTTRFYRESAGRKPFFRIKLFGGNVVDIQDGRVFSVKEGDPNDIENWTVSRDPMTFEEFVDETY